MLFAQMFLAIKRLVREEDGQGMVEYGLIIALIAVVVIGALTLLGTGISGMFTGILETLGWPTE